MHLFRGVATNLDRYNPQWETAMAIDDLAQWLVNWKSSGEILDLYLECQALAHVTLPGYRHRLAGQGDPTIPAWRGRAKRIAGAAWVALDPEIAGQVAGETVLAKKAKRSVPDAQRAQDEKSWAVLGLLVVFEQLMFPTADP